MKRKTTKPKRATAPRKAVPRRLIIIAAVMVLAIVGSAYYFFVLNAVPRAKGYEVGIVDQFYSSSPKFSDEAKKFFSELGMSVDIHKDENVTVDLYRNLPAYGYKLIILRVHAGIADKLSDRPTFMFTTEGYTASKYVIEQFTEQLMSGVIDPNNPVNPVFTVGPGFIGMSKGNYTGATVILSSCLGMYNERLAEAFVEKGAKTFISWDERVSLRHTDDAVTLLLKLIYKDRLTTEDAVESVMTSMGPDPVYGGVLEYYPS